MKTKKTLIAGALAAAWGLGAPSLGMAQSIPVTFDPLGTGGTNAYLVDSFDWNVGNAVAKGAVPLGPAPQSFEILAHSSLSALNLNGGGTLDPSTLGVEITFVTRFAESGFASGTSAVFTAPKNQMGSFFEIWVDSTPDANQDNGALAGTGYNDGVLALRGIIKGGAGTFTNFTQLNPSAFPTQNLDGYNADDWGGQQTDQGVGATSITVSVNLNQVGGNNNPANPIYINPDYFPLAGSVPQEFTVSMFNTSVIVPYGQVNPSTCFTPSSSGATTSRAADPYCDGTAFNVDPAGYNPNIGAVNGENGPDLLLQADANMSFAPEPASMALLGAGLLGLGFGARRRARREAV